MGLPTHLDEDHPPSSGGLRASSVSDPKLKVLFLFLGGLRYLPFVSTSSEAAASAFLACEQLPPAAGTE